MSQPTIHQLETLLHRLTQSKTLTPTDIALLDLASANLCNSQMANLYNQITLFLSESSVGDFFTCLGLVTSYSSSPQTQLLTYSILLRKVGRDWRSYDGQSKQSILQSIVQTMNGCMEEQSNAPILHIINQILVCIFRLQPKKLFQDFTASLNENRENMSKSKLINNLSIIRLIFSQAFTANHLSDPESFLQFRNQVQLKMVSFLTFFRFCLQCGRESSSEILKKGIEIIKLSIEHIPCFDLFNCDIIEYLVGLAVIPQHQRDLNLCFEEIFRFKQRSQSNENHSKIMQKLLFILEFYLQRFQKGSRFSTLQDKDSPSTESSFKSQSTKKASDGMGASRAKDLLIILYEFLNRYAPFMDKTRVEGDNDIEFQENIKIYYSEQLYNSLRTIYYKINASLEIILQEMDPFHINNINYQVLEMYRMIVSCVKNMIILFGKLNIGFNHQISNLIKLTICYLTPYPKDFVECYLKYELLQKGCERSVSLPLLSEQLQEEYRQFLRAITKQRQPLRYLISLFNSLSNANQLIYELSEEDRMKAGMSMMSTFQMQQYCHLKTINQINRICWSVVYAFEVSPSEVRDLKLMNFYRMVNNYTKIKVLAPYYKCLSINAKYTALICYPEQPLWRALVYAMQQSTLHEDILELILLILVRVFSNPDAKIKISEHEIKMVIDKTREIEAMENYDDRIMSMYPALAKVLFNNIENNLDDSEFDNEEDVVNEEEILFMMVGEQFQKMKASQRLLEMHNSPNLQKVISLLKRLDLIGCKVVSLFGEKNISEHQYKCICYIRQQYMSIFTDYEYKYTKFSQHLQTVTQETFDLYDNLEFCRNYIRLQELIIKLTITISRFSQKQSKKTSKSQKMSMQVLIKSSTLLRNTFISQPLFKLKEFFSCQRELYRYLIASENSDCLQAINNWITEILAALHQWYEDQSVVSEKYKFMKDIVILMGLKINKINMKAILIVFYDFYDTKLTSNHLQLILDIVEEMTTMVKNDLFRSNKNQLDFEQFIDTLKKTFEICFSHHAENEYLFERITNILFHQKEIIRTLRFSLQPKKKEDNTTILFLLLQMHISQVVNFSQDDKHNRQLRRIIQEPDLRRWKDEMRSYVFYVRRATEEHNRQQ